MKKTWMYLIIVLIMLAIAGGIYYYMQASADVTGTSPAGIRLKVNNYIYRARRGITIKTTIWLKTNFKSADGTKTVDVFHPELVTKATDKYGRIYIADSEITALKKNIPASITIEGVTYNYQPDIILPSLVAIGVYKGDQWITDQQDIYLKGEWVTRIKPTDPVSTTAKKNNVAFQFRYALNSTRLYMVDIYK